MEVIKQYMPYLVKAVNIAKTKTKTVKKIFSNMFSLKLLKCKPMRLMPRQINASDKV